MRRIDGSKNLVRRLRIIALCALLVSGVAWALDSVTPVHYRYTGTTGSGVNTTATWRLAKSGAASTYVERQFATSAASIGGIAKAIIKRGALAGAAYYAAEAIINGAGWAINELSKQVQMGDPSPEIAPGAYYWVNGADAKWYTNPQASCAERVKMMNPGDRWSVTGGGSYRNNGALYDCEIFSSTYNVTSVSTQTRGKNGTTPAQSADPSTIQEVSDADLGQKVIEAGGENVNKLLEAGGVVQITPELLEQQNALKAAKAAEAGEPAPTPDVMPTEQEQANKKPAEEEWPKFCTWAGVVCDFIDWFKKDDQTTDKPELPVDPVALPEQNWNSGLPSDASCPTVPAISFSLMGQSVNQEISMGPLCTVAEMFRPFIIALSVLIAAYIIGGVRNDA